MENSTVAVTIAAALLIYVGRAEWNLHSLKTQIAEQQAKIDRDKAASDQAIALFKKYQGEEAKLNEVDAFVKSKPAVSKLLLHLGQTLPKNIAYDRFELRANGLVLVATVRGAPTQAAEWASAYIEQLRADKELSLFDELQQTSSGRNPQGRITIELFLHLKGTPPRK